MRNNETIRSFGESIYNSKNRIVEAEEHQSNLLENLVQFNNKSRQKKIKIKKEILMEVHMLFMRGRELTLNDFKCEIFPIKLTKGEGLKILTPKHMLKRLPISLAQVKAGNTSENLLNEIRKIIYFFY